MAITQISRVQVRRGLKQDLPQLASAELGWSIDSQQLFIGNGDADEGAPTVGVTEILTQHSNLSSLIGTYSTASNLSITAGTTTIVNLPLGASQMTYQISNSSSLRYGTLRFINTGLVVVFDDDYLETPVSFSANVYANTAGVLSCTIGTGAVFSYNLTQLA